jgi:hypothetical protein
MDARSQLLSVNLANFCGELNSPPTPHTPPTLYNHGYLQSRSAGNDRCIKRDPAEQDVSRTIRAICFESQHYTQVR